MTAIHDAPSGALRSFRAALSEAIGPLPIVHAAARAGCSQETLFRVLRGENVTIRTAERIAANLGGRLIVCIALPDERPSHLG
jgi:hypothetical protein